MRTAILGAGALGLTAARRLARSGDHVTVFEREPMAGGLAAGFEIEPGMWLEKFYHHIFRSDRSAIALIEELGLSDRLTWGTPVTATLRDGGVHRLDSAGSLLRFAPLPPRDRVRMGAALAVLKAMPSARLLEGRTALAWTRRWMGRTGTDVVWEPLLRGKFGAAAPEVAMPWFWARIHDRTQALGYLRGGFQQLYDRLAADVREAGGDVHLGVSVQSVRVAGQGLTVVTDRGEEGFDRVEEGFDRVVSTFAPRLTARLVEDLPASWRERHDWGRALGAHCVILALDRPLTSAYWLNVNDPGYPFMALVEHTNYQPAAHYGGRHLVYLGNYRPADDPLMHRPKDEVVEEFVRHLPRIAPDFDPSWITDAWMFAAPFAQPIVTTEYREHVPPFRTPVPNLWTASMFQVYPHDRGQNYSIALADRLVSAMSSVT